MAKRKYYPSTPKGKQSSQTDWNRISQDDTNQMPYDITPMVNFQDTAVNKQFTDWKNKFQDEWVNNVASINAHNSIAQYNEYILNRVSYVECSHLSIDTIINNAITKFANGCIRKGGEIILSDDDNIDNPEELIVKIEKRFKELGGLEKINELIKVCLTYGSAYLFIDVNGKDLIKPLVFSSSVFEKNKISNLQVIPPYGMGASAVETANMLDKNYMRPSQWYVQGGGTVDISRLIELIIFDCPNLIKPIFNFGGISLCQFMKNYVSTADSTRQSLADIMLRYKTDIIQSNLTKVNPEDAKARAGAINRHRNNLGLLLLTEDEVFQQVNTPIAGLENISAHQMEYVSVAGRTPATILFGLTPAGLNATGEFELDSYYDELASLQNSKIKPAIEQILYMICLELGYDIKPEYKFNELKKDNELVNAQVQGTYIDNATKLKDGGFLTEEQVVDYLKSKDVLADNIEYVEEEIDLDTPEENQVDIPNVI